MPLPKNKKSNSSNSAAIEAASSPSFVKATKDFVEALSYIYDEYNKIEDTWTSLSTQYGIIGPNLNKLKPVFDAFKNRVVTAGRSMESHTTVLEKFIKCLDYAARGFLIYDAAQLVSLTKNHIQYSNDTVSKAEVKASINVIRATIDEIDSLDLRFDEEFNKAVKALKAEAKKKGIDFVFKIEKNLTEKLKAAVVRIKNDPILLRLFASEFTDSSAGRDLISLWMQKHKIRHGLMTLIKLHSQGNKNQTIKNDVVEYVNYYYQDGDKAELMNLVNLDIMGALDDLKDELVKTFKHNDKNLKKYAEGEKDDPLGYIVFGQDRVGNKAPWEQDTEYERDLYRALSRHINDNKPADGETVSKIKSILKKELYPKMFAEPSTEVVYRGMSVTLEWLKRALKRSKIDEKGSEEKTFTFTPIRGETSSWTNSKKVTERFTSENSHTYAVILHARVEDNPDKFLDLTKGMYKNVGRFAPFNNEKESIGLGKIKVFKIEWKRR